MLPSRKGKSFDWTVEEPELIEYAVTIAGLWMDREMRSKGRITADYLNKACGILAEEILVAELNELNVQHTRTVPLLAKDHPVNSGKPFDVKIGACTIDVKSISPLAPPKYHHHKNLNVNKSEVTGLGACDLYLSSKCYPELDMAPKKVVEKEEALEILGKVENVEFLGYALKDEVIDVEHLVLTKSPFYSLPFPPPHDMKEFAERFGIRIWESGTISNH